MADAPSFSDLGIPSNPQLERNAIGLGRKLRDLNLDEKLYIGGMVVSILALVSLTIYRLSVVSVENQDFFFCIVLIVNLCFCTFYVFDGIKRERASELFLLSVAIILTVCYLVANYAQGLKTDVKLARMVVAIILAVILVPYGFRVFWKYKQENHLIFRIVGASSTLQSLLKRLFYFQDMLKFDMELQLSLMVLMFGWKKTIPTSDIVMAAVGIPLTLVLFCIGYFGFSREIKVLAILFFFLCLPGVAHSIYELYDVSSGIDTRKGLAMATLVCAVISIVVRFITICLAALVYWGFGNDLYKFFQPVREEDSRPQINSV